MTVTVELFATLGRYLPAAARNGGAHVELESGSTVADLVRALGIPAGLESVALVNGHECDDSHLLVEGDTVTLYPPLAGGCH